LEAPLIVKIGGSLITRKSEPMSVDLDAVRFISRLLASARGMVLVHGGGSFGHPVAMSRGLSSARPSGDAEGASATRLAMHELSLVILRELSAAGLRPFLIHSVDPDSPAFWDWASRVIRELLSAGATPVTHGDVGLSPGGFRVIGGDEICLRLAERLRPRRVVFLMDVPGVLADARDPSSLLEELDPESARSLAGRLSGADATGGISAKLRFAASIAELGIEVYLISGRSAPDVLKATTGDRPRGTLVRDRHGRGDQEEGRALGHSGLRGRRGRLPDHVAGARPPGAQGPPGAGPRRRRHVDRAVREEAPAPHNNRQHDRRLRERGEVEQGPRIRGRGVRLGHGSGEPARRAARQQPQVDVQRRPGRGARHPGVREHRGPAAGGGGGRGRQGMRRHGQGGRARDTPEPAPGGDPARGGPEVQGAPGQDSGGRGEGRGPGHRQGGRLRALDGGGGAAGLDRRQGVQRGGRRRHELG